MVDYGGGVVVRRMRTAGGEEQLQYALVLTTGKVRRQGDSKVWKQPKWGLPKGAFSEKKGDKTVKDTALREVQEELGFSCRALVRLGTVRQPKKKVQYWLMTVDTDASPSIAQSDVELSEWVGHKAAKRILGTPNKKMVKRAHAAAAAFDGEVARYEVSVTLRQ